MKLDRSHAPAMSHRKLVIFAVFDLILLACTVIFGARAVSGVLAGSWVSAALDALVVVVCAYVVMLIPPTLPQSLSELRTKRR